MPDATIKHLDEMESYIRRMLAHTDESLAGESDPAT